MPRPVPKFKAQHPEFELESGRARAQQLIACADCHMPYKREGRQRCRTTGCQSPLLNVSRACQVCHPYPEAEMRSRGRDSGPHLFVARSIGDRADRHAGRRGCRKEGRSDRGAAGARVGPPSPVQWRLDFIAAENDRVPRAAGVGACWAKPSTTLVRVSRRTRHGLASPRRRAEWPASGSARNTPRESCRRQTWLP